MIAAGEDPRFIARRLIISASEDVGNADPRALQVAVAAAQALDHIGLPEASVRAGPGHRVPVRVTAQSTAVGRAYFAAMDDVLKMGAQPVPLHLRNAADRRMKHHGIGIGYLNPHEFEGDDVAQQYLPDALAGRRYYHPVGPGLRDHDRGADGGEGRGTPREASPQDDPLRGRLDVRRGRRHAGRGRGPGEGRQDTAGRRRRIAGAGAIARGFVSLAPGMTRAKSLTCHRLR